MTIPETYYNPNTPISTESFAQWQENFSENFTQLDTAFSANHVPLEAASNAGNHNVIQLLEQASTRQTNVSEISVYTLDAPGQTDQLYMNIQGQEFQFTNYQIYPLTQPNTYFTFLPGRLIVYFGLFSPIGNGSSQNLYLLPTIAKNIVSANFTQAVPNVNVNGGGVQGFSPITNVPIKIVTGVILYTTTNTFYTIVCNV